MSNLQDIGIPYGRQYVACHSASVSSYSPHFDILDGTTTLGSELDLGGDTAGWVLEAAKKLESLGKRRAGWDSYGGLPLKRGARSLTLRALACLRNEELPVPAVVLGSPGTVQLEWRLKGKELEVELRDDDTIEFVKVYASGKIEEGNEAYYALGRLRVLTHWLING